MKEILKIKITKINDLWYAWHIDYIDKKVFEKNLSEEFAVNNKRFCYFAKESYEIDILEWTSAYGYKKYVIYLPTNSIDKKPCIIRKEIVEDLKKAIEWINNNVK